jgi:hypothetical protein
MDPMLHRYLTAREAWLDSRVALVAACARFILKNQRGPSTGTPL